jgi:hypothetical protein
LRVTDATEQLTPWNDTAARAAIADFVARVTTEGGPDFVPPAERIATFDNDGTLCCEKPMPERARLHPEREFDCTAGAETSLEAAAAEGWTVVSIKNDWPSVFA